MGSFTISTLQINPRIIIAAKRVKLHTGCDVLQLSGLELERLTSLSASDISQLQDAVVDALFGYNRKIPTALDLWNNEICDETAIEKLTTGCHHLDAALRGGLLTSGLTEIVGESGAGKTQLCMQLCLTAQLPRHCHGIGSGSIYISTEGAFPSKRLKQMSVDFTTRHRDFTETFLSDHIFLEHISDVDSLQTCLQTKVPLLLSRNQVRLIVVDSLAALFRSEYDQDKLSTRAKHLASVAWQLRRLADQYHAVVVCVNQVTANIRDGVSVCRQAIPALGLVWADHVTCRLMMSKCQLCDVSVTTVDQTTLSHRTSHSVTSTAPNSYRQVEVIFAPHLSQSVVPVYITNSGICDG